MERTGLSAQGKIGERLERTALRIDAVERLKDVLQIGNIYRIRTEYRTDDRGHPTFMQYTQMQCIGTYPHIATFRPIDGSMGFPVSFSYVELCRGVLKDAQYLMKDLPEDDYEEELF